MKFRSVALLLSLVLVVGSGLAHGDKKHVRGLLEKVNADSVVVKTAEGKSVEVRLVGSTVYLLRSGKEDKPAKASDLAVGDRVVIHATPKGEILEADEIKFSAPSASAKPASAAAKPKQ